MQCRPQHKRHEAQYMYDCTACRSFDARCICSKKLTFTSWQKFCPLWHEQSSVDVHRWPCSNDIHVLTWYNSHRDCQPSGPTFSNMIYDCFHQAACYHVSLQDMVKDLVRHRTLIQNSKAHIGSDLVVASTAKILRMLKVSFADMSLQFQDISSYEWCCRQHAKIWFSTWSMLPWMGPLYCERMTIKKRAPLIRAYVTMC